MKKLLAAALSALMPVVSFAADFVEGKDYQRLSSPGQVEKAGMIEVREFFWYGCPHCFRLDPFVGAWLKTKPKDVNFIRTPAALNPQWEVNARGFYAVDLMDPTLIEKTHAPLFSFIHEKGARPFDPNSLSAFYANYGVDKNKFLGMYNSFAVTGKISQSKALAQKYQLDGVPVMVVNAKYKVSGENGKALDVVNYLIAKERSGK